MWVGFPYSTDSEAKFDIENIDKKINQLPDDHSVLLLTHNGPFSSGTTLFCTDFFVNFKSVTKRQKFRQALR